MDFLKPFRPTGDTTTLAVTATNTQGTVMENASQVLLTNLGPNKCFVRFGKSLQTAAVASDMPILPGTSRVITKDAMNNVAAICAATETATLYITPGEGV